MRTWTIESNPDHFKATEGIEIKSQLFLSIGSRPLVFEYRAYVFRDHSQQIILKQGGKLFISDVNLENFQANGCLITKSKFREDVRLVILWKINHYNNSIFLYRPSNVEVIVQKTMIDYKNDPKDQKTELLAIFSPGGNDLVCELCDLNSKERKFLRLSYNNKTPIVTFE